MIKLTKKTFTIAKWEFLDKVRRKSFMIFLIIFPAVLILLGMLPTLISTPINSHEIKIIGIIDETDRLIPLLRHEFEDISAGNLQPDYLMINLREKSLSDKEIIDNARHDLSNNVISGIVTISESDRFQVGFIAADLLSTHEIMLIKEKIRLALIKDKFSSTTGELKFEDNAEFNFDLQKSSDSARASVLVFVKSFIFLILLAVITLFYGGNFIRSFIEEKSNGLMEIFLSSCSISDILYGKLFGLIILGGFQLLVWTVIGLILKSAEGAADISVNYFALQVIYFLLGYILFGSIFIGAGALLRTEFEAQQITSILSIIMIIPILISIQTIMQPYSLLSTLLTYFPLSSPPLMLLKINIGIVDYTEIITTIFIIIISIFIINYTTVILFRKKYMVSRKKN